MSSYYVSTCSEWYKQNKQTGLHWHGPPSSPAKVRRTSNRLTERNARTRARAHVVQLDVPPARVRVLVLRRAVHPPAPARVLARVARPQRLRRRRRRRRRGYGDGEGRRGEVSSIRVMMS